MAGRIDDRSKELGIELPTPSAPGANYVPFVRTGDLVFLTGQLSQWNGERRFIGKLGREFGVEEGQQAARLCALSLVAHLRSALEGDLDRARWCVRVAGFVNGTPEFVAHSQVINGALRPLRPGLRRRGAPLADGGGRERAAVRRGGRGRGGLRGPLNEDGEVDSMRHRRQGSLAILIGLCVSATAFAAAPRAAFLGTWKGTSTCVKGPEFPSCHDEVVVYEVKESARGGDAVTLDGFKIVDGEKQFMGDLEFTWDAGQEAWVCELTTPRVHALWTFFVRGDELAGTLVDLPSKHLIRNVAAKREKK